jgi:hypothetical protein
MASERSGEVEVVAVVDEAAADALDEAAADVLVLPIIAPTGGDNRLGEMGRPLDRRAPFFVGLTGALGVAVAYVIAVGIGDIASVLILIGLALFIAIGLNPVVALLVRRGLSRSMAVAIVTSVFLVVIVAFVLAAVGPISNSVQNLVTNYPATGPTSQRAGAGLASWCASST